ncbi:TPA: hypothetical protein ENS27_11255 [bacterium]|nr:hypothetical protein [bacterium]
MDNIELYKEKYRPQFHFTAKENWLNDPNGLTYYDGEYHLFFQYNPKGLDWGPNTWGHAISTDLVHWKQIQHAIEPDEYGWIWSGSGVVDWKNTAGLKNGNENAMIAIYTTGGYGQPTNLCVQDIAYSNDNGRTWYRYENNPVLRHIVASNRDPKVIWYEPTQKWIMALYLDASVYAIFSSSNLKDWVGQTVINLPGASECPDIFELPVDGDKENKKWVFWGGNGNYYIGSFNGDRFQPESDVLRADYGANFYAGQTWSDIPESDGRRIQIAWMAGGKYPNMPFNQQMSFPCELTLRTTSKGIQMYRLPVKEIELLRKNGFSWSNQRIGKDSNLLSNVNGDLFDIYTEFELSDANEFGFKIHGEVVKYDFRAKQLSFLGRIAHLEPIESKIKLQILIDRTSIEVFGNDGQLSMSSCFLPDLDNLGIDVYALGGEVLISSMNIYELHSAWI